MWFSWLSSLLMLVFACAVSLAVTASNAGSVEDMTTRLARLLPNTKPPLDACWCWENPESGSENPDSGCTAEPSLSVGGVTSVAAVLDMGTACKHLLHTLSLSLAIFTSITTTRRTMGTTTTHISCTCHKKCLQQFYPFCIIHLRVRARMDRTHNIVH